MCHNSYGNYAKSDTTEICISNSYAFRVGLAVEYIEFRGSGMIYIVAGIAALCIICYLLWRIGNAKPQAAVQPAPSSPSILGDPRSENILEAVSDGIVVINPQGIITLFNTAAGYLAGWKTKDALNIDYRSVFKLCDQKGNPYTDDTNPFSLALREGRARRDSDATLITQGSGKHISVSISISPLTDKQGKFNGVVGIMRDVSEEKMAERQRSEFISTASHEMRTPVAAIEGYLALAMNDKVSKVDAKARNYLAKAHESAQHLGSLFQDLLSSSKAEDGRLINHPEVIEMGSFLGQLSEDLRFGAEKKQLAVEFVVGVSGASMNAESEAGSIRVVQPLYHVYADPERIREVVTNIFDNAVKYTDHGKISIGLTGDDNVVQVYVKDTGSGIAREDIPHLFQKFYRVDNTTTRTIGGTGLGLFISRKIIEMYNGRIWVESEPGKGSTFYINLPRLSKDKVTELAGSAATEIVPGSVVVGDDEDED
jgi:PAS domain S-box-containing protein